MWWGWRRRRSSTCSGLATDTEDGSRKAAIRGSEVDYGFGSLASVMDTRFGQFASVVWNPFLQFEDECFWLLASSLHFQRVRRISTGTFIYIINMP